MRIIRSGWRQAVARGALIVNAVWAVPAVLVIRALRPWVVIRMGTMDTSRIGHFSAESTILLIRQALRAPEGGAIDLFWIPRKTANQQWARMVRRKLRVHWSVRYLAAFNDLIPGGAAHALLQPTASANRDSYAALHSSAARFELTAEEDATARSWMRRHGWKDGEPIVCLAVRDSAYLSLDSLHSYRGADGWQYHNYRDSEIETYVEAVNAVLDKGYWVVRMGKFVHKRIPLQHERVIDYPFELDRDDLIDIWLCINCAFFVTSGTGIDTIPFIYGRPVVYVNSLPLKIVLSSIDHIWLPKHLRWKATGRLLTLGEHLRNGYARTSDYEEVGIEIEDLSSAEIAAAVDECERRARGEWAEAPEDRVRQQRFWDELRRWDEFTKYHGYVHPESRVGSEWLRSMGDEFFDN